MIYQYFSKWQNKWVDFKKNPTKGELLELKKYFYRIKIK